MDNPVRMETARSVTPAEAPRLAVVANETAARRKRKPRRRWPYVLGVLLLAGGGAAAWQWTQATAPADRVITETVARGDVESNVTAAGVLEPVRDVDVGAQVSGQLKSLKVAIGDEVAEGDLIAEIDSASIENQIEVNEAELANLEALMIDRSAQLELRRANLERQRNLVATKSAARSAEEEAVAALATAQANVDSLKAQIRKQQAQLKDARTSLGYTKIFAPIAGSVVNTTAKEGQTLNANQQAPTIATLADLSTMTVKAQVSEADVGKLSLGMQAYFTLLGQSETRYPGTLRQIQPTPATENNVVLYNALFDVANPDRRLMIDMTAQVFFVQAAAKDVLTIPVAALSDVKGDRASVIVVAADGSRTSREITTGVRNRVRVEIREGLAEGDVIVVGTVPANAAAAPTTSSRRGGLPPPM